MDSQKRLWTALAISFGMTLVYMLWFMPKPPPQPGAANAPAPAAAPPAGPKAEAPPPAPKVATPAPAAGANEAPVREIHHAQELVKLTLTSRGAGLVGAELLGKKMREQPHLTPTEGLQVLLGKKLPDGPQMDMALPSADRPPALAVALSGAQPVSPTARYRAEELPGGAVRFTAREGALEVTKTFTWNPQSAFDWAMDVEVKNTGAQSVQGDLAISYGRAVEPGSEVKPSFFGGVGNVSLAACTVGDSLEKKSADGKPPAEHSGALSFFGVNQQYFLAAVYPLDGPKQGRCVLSAGEADRVATAYFPVQIAPGQSFHQRFGVFIGPKDIDLLRSVPERMKALGFASAAAESAWSLNGSSFPHLERAVDFGIWAFICKILLGIMKFFHLLFRNWGVAIIMLTVVIKLVLLPLTHKSMVSAEAMKKLQPKIEEIRKKFAQDRERQNLETMKLYQEAKVNPLGGCLPMLVQMPVWIALYATLRNSYEIYREPFIAPLWSDLTFRDPTYLLPVALGLTQIITQRLQPQMMDAAQARLMTYVMPVFFTFIMVNYPAGLSLYIFTNNLLTMAQQYGLRRYLEKKGVAAPRNTGSKKVRRELHERHASGKRSA